MIKLKSLLMEGMSPGEANNIFKKYGISGALQLSKEELIDAYRKLSKLHHPDKGGKTLSMQYINSAFDVLKKRLTYSHGNTSHNVERDVHVTAPWSWAGHSGGMPPSDNGGDNPQDINYIKKQAWKMSGEPAPDKKNEFTFWNWDGRRFSGSVTVFAKYDYDILFKISELVVKWITLDFSESKAVFFNTKSEPKRLFLINVNGKKTDPEEFEHDSFNSNPGNDKEFVDNLKNKKFINI